MVLFLQICNTVDKERVNWDSFLELTDSVELTRVEEMISKRGWA